MSELNQSPSDHNAEALELIKMADKHHIVELEDWVFLCTQAYMRGEQNEEENTEDLSSYDFGPAPYWIYAKDGSTPQPIMNVDDMAKYLEKQEANANESEFIPAPAWIKKTQP